MTFNRPLPLIPAAVAIVMALGSAAVAQQATGEAGTGPQMAGPPAIGQTLGTSIAEIATALEAAGHRIREIEREGDRFEVEIGRRGRGHELYVDAASGRVTKIERNQ